MEFLGDTTGEVDKGFIHLSTVKHFISSVKLGISFLHEWNPEFSDVVAATVKWSFTLSVVRDSSIYDNVLPPSIFEELKDSETVLDTIVHY